VLAKTERQPTSLRTKDEKAKALKDNLTPVLALSLRGAAGSRGRTMPFP